LRAVGLAISGPLCPGRDPDAVRLGGAGGRDPVELLERRAREDAIRRGARGQAARDRLASRLPVRVRLDEGVAGEVGNRVLKPLLVGELRAVLRALQPVELRLRVRERRPVTDLLGEA